MMVPFPAPYILGAAFIVSESPPCSGLAGLVSGFDTVNIQTIRNHWQNQYPEHIRFGSHPLFLTTRHTSI